MILINRFHSTRTATLLLVALTAVAPVHAQVTVPLTDLVGVLRPAELTLGADLGEEKPPTPFQAEALNAAGRAPAARTVWMAEDAIGPQYGPLPGAPLVVRVTCLIAEINGEKGCGPAALIPGFGQFLFLAGEDAKNTDTLRLLLVDTVVGTVGQLAAVSLAGGINVYGGSIPPPNCDHNRGQADWHMYCQWFDVVLTVEQLPDGRLHVTGQVFLHGHGPLNDATRANAYDPTLTPIGATLSYTGSWPHALPTFGNVGVAFEGRQTLVQASAVNLVVEGTPLLSGPGPAYQ